MSTSTTGTYVGVPDNYLVPQGESKQLHYSGMGASGPQYTPETVYGQPMYRKSDLMALYGKGPGQVWDTQRKLYSLGLLPTFVPGTYDQKTRDALEVAYTAANANGVSLDAMLANRDSVQEMLKKAGLGGGGSSGGGSGSSGGPRTVTQSNVTLTSREGAQQVLSQALAQQLGRQPSPDELTRFTRALNVQEKANPTVTVQKINAKGDNQSTVTKQGNVDNAYQADQFAKTTSPAERSRFQDSQYMDTIAQMIGAK